MKCHLLLLALSFNVSLLSMEFFKDDQVLCDELEFWYDQSPEKQDEETLEELDQLSRRKISYYLKWAKEILSTKAFDSQIKRAGKSFQVRRKYVSGIRNLVKFADDCLCRVKERLQTVPQQELKLECDKVRRLEEISIPLSEADITYLQEFLSKYSEDGCKVEKYKPSLSPIQEISP